MFDELEDDGLDIDAIFGGGSSETPNPFTAPEQPAAKPAAPATPTPLQRQATPVKPEAERTDNLIEDAFTQQETKSLFEKAPIFSYGGATEEIQDASLTFEELRIAKSDDFPELGEGKKVSWSVEYGKTVKMIADPKSTTIASVKEEIERSKAFLDGLKKAKEKSPDCLVKPRVRRRARASRPTKGVFLSGRTRKPRISAFACSPRGTVRCTSSEKRRWATSSPPKATSLSCRRSKPGLSRLSLRFHGSCSDRSFLSSGTT
jgi:hypothetical protein